MAYLGVLVDNDMKIQVNLAIIFYGINNRLSNWVSKVLHAHVLNNRKCDNWLIYETQGNIEKPIILKDKYYNRKYEGNKIH